MNSNNNNNKPFEESSASNSKRHYITPDYGSAYVPNAGPAHLAPKSLDHFKRGYQERAAQRDKEYYSRRHGPTGRDSRSFEHRGHNDRPTVVNGLDINRLADRVSAKLSDQKALFAIIEEARESHPEAFETGRVMTALISVAARRKNIGLGWATWDYMDHANLAKNTYHYNSMISITEKARNYHQALNLMKEMSRNNIPKNEVTFSSAISACEKCGEWKTAIDLLESMDKEGVKRTAIAYNATISACEKGMVPQKACEVFQRMKGEGISPSVVSYSALISAAEKGGQWKLALDILEEMKREGFTGNVVAYSAAISACAKGQQWRRALQLFREIQSHGGSPSIVTYNATMTALEKGMQWERAMDLFEEMKMRNLSITVVSYGSAISACDKGFQFRQCLEFLDEMTDMGIQKNVIIFGAAMSCMEKCSRADIGFELLKRMREEGITPNVHIYNSLISACARSNLWEKGYDLYEEMEKNSVKRDVVTYNAVLDAVSSQIRLGRRLFNVGVEKGFYAKVSRLGEHWFELDLHFLSLGGGEIALGWWFEDCLVPYLKDTTKLETVKSISIVTGYGKTRTRGRRHGDDGMRKRCKAMLRFMNIKENDQTNAGRLHVDKESLIEEVNRNGGRVNFDIDAYIAWKEVETTANVIPDVEQKIRARFRPKNSGSGRPPFVRVESESTSEEYLLRNLSKRTRKDDEFIGNEYRSDIDYAVRDGIQFKLGTQLGQGEPPRGRPGDNLRRNGEEWADRRRDDPYDRNRNSNNNNQFRGNRGQDRGGQHFEEPSPSHRFQSPRSQSTSPREPPRRNNTEQQYNREGTRDNYHPDIGRDRRDSRDGPRRQDDVGYYGRSDDHQEGMNHYGREGQDRGRGPDRNAQQGDSRRDSFDRFQRSEDYNQRGKDNGGGGYQEDGMNPNGRDTGYSERGGHRNPRHTDGPDFDQPRGPRQDHHGRNDSYNRGSRGDGGRFQSNQRDNDDRSFGRRNEHSDHMERNGGYKREESDSFNNRNNGNRFGDEARGHDLRNNPRDRNFRQDFPERERYREQNGRDGGRHRGQGHNFDDSGSSNGRTSSDIPGGERRPSIRGYALEPPTKRNRLS